MWRRHTPLLMLVGCSLLAGLRAPAEARPVRTLQQANESLPPGRSVAEVVTSLIAKIDAAAPAPGSINAGTPSDKSGVAFAHKYEAIVAAGLPLALYRYAGNDAGSDGSPAEQAQALEFLQGILTSLNNVNQAAAAQLGNAGAVAPAPAATSLTDASNQVAAVIAQHLAEAAAANAQTGTLSLAAGPSSDAKDLFKYVLATELEDGISTAESPGSNINLLAGLLAQGQVSEGFAGANILGLSNGGDSLGAAALQAGEQLLGRDGSIPQAPTGAAAAPAPTVNLENNGL
ncbi:hypothetical protein WJX74_009292 [Apatococcus lobatus]|uniref:Uncharacterized protein n=1 Tax=Apatococcus lobatus TaxID=904363 RepID=A0AAW1RHL2_9CHLO